MLSFSLKQKIIITNIGILLILFLIFGLIIIPAGKQILDLRNNIKQIENDLEQRYEQTKKLKKSLQELDTIRAQTAELRSTIPKIGDELMIITTLENIARQHNIEQNLSLNLINESLSKNPKSLHKALPNHYRLSFLNNGLMIDHLLYLRALEKLPFYVIIDSLNFDKRQGTKIGETSPLTLRLEAIIYVENIN